MAGRRGRSALHDVTPQPPYQPTAEELAEVVVIQAKLTAEGYPQMETEWVDRMITVMDPPDLYQEHKLIEDRLRLARTQAAEEVTAQARAAYVDEEDDDTQTETESLTELKVSHPDWPADAIAAMYKSEHTPIVKQKSTTVNKTTDKPPADIGTKFEGEGDAEKFKHFKVEIACAFAENPKDFYTEARRIIYIRKQLKGKASYWALDKIQGADVNDPDSCLPFDTVGKFLQAMEEEFIPVDAYLKIHEKLQKLHQGHWSIREFTRRFTSLADQLELSDQTKLQYYVTGLRDDVETFLSNGFITLKDENFDSYSKRALRLRGKIAESHGKGGDKDFGSNGGAKKNEKDSNKKKNENKEDKKTMDPKKQDNTADKPKGPIAYVSQKVFDAKTAFLKMNTDERTTEFERRQNAGECTYCTDAGHIKKDCTLNGCRLEVAKK